MLEYIRLTDKQDLTHNDMANPRELNEIIWFSVRGDEPMPQPSRLAMYDLMKVGLKPENAENEAEDDDD